MTEHINFCCWRSSDIKAFQLRQEKLLFIKERQLYGVQFWHQRTESGQKQLRGGTKVSQAIFFLSEFFAIPTWLMSLVGNYGQGDSSLKMSRLQFFTNLSKRPRGAFRSAEQKLLSPRAVPQNFCNFAKESFLLLPPFLWQYDQNFICMVR